MGRCVSQGAVDTLYLFLVTRLRLSCRLVSGWSPAPSTAAFGTGFGALKFQVHEVHGKVLSPIIPCFLDPRALLGGEDVTRGQGVPTLRFTDGGGRAPGTSGPPELKAEPGRCAVQVSSTGLSFGAPRWGGRGALHITVCGSHLTRPWCHAALKLIGVFKFLRA